LETKHEKRTAPRPRLFVRRKDYKNRGYNPKKLSWVRVPVTVDPVGRKISTIEEWHQYPSCFHEKVSKTKATVLKTIVDSRSDEIVSVEVENKHDIRTAPRPRMFVLTRALQKQRPQPQKSVLCLSPN
jgi:hypothetical protein